MSKIFGVLIGILVFCLFFTLIFELGNSINDGYGVNVSDEYAERTDFYTGIGSAAQEDVLNISEKSPGGTEGSVGAAGEDVQVGGLRAMASIFKAPGNVKKILMGSDANNTGLAGKIGIDPRITSVGIVALFFMIALILIGAILRNRI